MADLKEAEATRDGQTQASADLDRFYARRAAGGFRDGAPHVTHLKLAQLARSHDVAFQSGAASTETLRDSTLERLHVNYALTGDWEDIRQLIYEIETGPDFIVIDNVAARGRIAGERAAVADAGSVDVLPGCACPLNDGN